MGISYKDVKDVTLNDSQKITIQSLNRLYSRMIDNDKKNLPSESSVPGIWERKWINNPSRTGYRKGQAVWINTEEPGEFISKHQTDIYDYLINNDEYRDRVLEYSSDQSKLNSFYREFMNGELYYLGDITKPVQLRVCKADDVKATPDDDEYWQDFFTLRDDNSLTAQIALQFSSTANEQFENHIQQFHPENNENVGLDDYMLNDFSNVSKKQQHNRFNLSYMQGFDCVVKFVRKRYSDFSVKWFRLWKSGYLEQGGQFDMENPTAGGDSIAYGNVEGKIATINLCWKYKDGRTAPYFDYLKSDLRPFYDVDQTLKTDISSSMQYQKADNLDATYRYFVQLTPVFTGDSGIPYETFDETYRYYVSRDITGITNKQFSFVITPGYSRYQYYVSGFTVSRVGSR